MSRLDLSELGREAAALMERLEADYDDGCSLGVVAVIAEVVGQRGETEWSVIEYRCSDGRRWVQAGLFEQARRAAHESTERLDEDE